MMKTIKRYWFSVVIVMMAVSMAASWGTMPALAIGWHVVMGKEKR